MHNRYKVTTWNIEWLGSLLRDDDDNRKSVNQRARLQLRLLATSGGIKRLWKENGFRHTCSLRFSDSP
ncbi:MAG: hypothetical protein CVV06_01945 [Gammaproteobacteria bacterium HGW-Gammaproteobacteria-10]|nr:MAG: hypothetical protein CVV06_01945 [Gammaproteobacteria bacterium HGW-Gammaproteobacteria-10]